ncbi:MAG: hypothetical protein ACTHMQ_01705 [Protaetiibacter sp.]
MTTTPPDGSAPAAPESPAARRTRAATMSLYLAIGALVAAAALGGYFIIVGDQANVAGRAWLTLFLVGLFAGAVVLDANAGNGPNRWYLGVSTIVNVVLVAIGLIKLWNGWLQPEDTSAATVWFVQTMRLVLIIVLFRLALLFTQLYGLHFVTRARSQLGKLMAIVTIGLVWATALILAIPAAFPEPEWPDWWWRVAGATTLVAVVTTVIPLIVRAFEPKAPKPVQPAQPVQQYYQAPAYYAQQPVQVQPVQVQPVPPGVQPVPPGVQPVPPQPVPPQPAPPVQQQAVPPVPPAPGAPTPPQ